MIRSGLLRTLAPSVALTLLGFLLAYQFVDPAPPRQLAMATGDEQGAYFLFAHHYRERLAKEGIELAVKATAGSVENLGLLAAGEHSVDAAFVQGGVRQAGDDTELFSLGSLYYEPLWVFHRGDARIRRLPDLKSRRVAVGKVGSGTQKLAYRILAANGLDAQNTQLLTLGGDAAVAQLLAGEVDAIFMVAAARSPSVIKLLSSAGIQLMSFERADAYTRNLRFLSNVVLPEGAIDLARNIPPRDTVLLAATANLVVQKDLHPALIDLLLQAAQEVHGDGGWFEKTGQFPAPEHLEFPLSPEARRFYKYGPPFLQRFLPFWAASFVDRMKVMLLPMVALLFPLLKIMPPLYRWRMRSKIYHWYRELQDIDLGLEREIPLSRDHCRTELDRIEHEVARVEVPLSFADELFNLRLHIELIRRRVEAKDQAPEASADAG